TAPKQFRRTLRGISPRIRAVSNARIHLTSNAPVRTGRHGRIPIWNTAFIYFLFVTRWVNVDYSTDQTILESANECLKESIRRSHCAARIARSRLTFRRRFSRESTDD